LFLSTNFSCNLVFRKKIFESQFFSVREELKLIFFSAKISWYQRFSNHERKKRWSGRINREFMRKFSKIFGASVYILCFPRDLEEWFEYDRCLWKTIYLGSWTINSPNRDAPTSTKFPPPSPHFRAPRSAHSFLCTYFMAYILPVLSRFCTMQTCWQKLPRNLIPPVNSCPLR